MAHENSTNAHKDAQKGSKSYKPYMNNVVSAGMNFEKTKFSMSSVGLVRLEKYCAKMYSRDLLPCGGFTDGFTVTQFLLLN